MCLIRESNSIIDFIDNDECDLLGEKTYFRQLSKGIITNIVSNGKWFSFCTRINDSQVDVFSIKNNRGIKLGALVNKELNSESGYRTSLFRYLLFDYLCYCEIPTVIRKKDYSGFKDSYTKCLVTANIGVIANWLGLSYDKANMLYGSRLADTSFDRDDDMFPYVKLTVDKSGVRKVSKPRKDLELSTKGLRIVPVFAINEGIKRLYKVCSKDFYDITFVKDSGQVRTINVCFNYDKLSSVYSDKGLLSNYFEEQFDGNFLESPTFDRGYIKVIEVGTSLRSSPTRSLNIARILKFEKAKPDTTFINIDLNYVKEDFLNFLYGQKINYKELVSMLDIFQVGNSREYNGRSISSYSELEGWVESQLLLLSTPFLKQLALFMKGNPQWFNGYTGEHKKQDSVVIGNDYFADELEFGM